MPVDNCDFSFKELSDVRLPQLMKKIREAMDKPLPMSFFAQPGVGKSTIFKRLDISSDFPGCYVLIEESKPVYVGISRSVVQRLIQHVRGKTHFEASLAYRMAASVHKHKMSRRLAMENEDFRLAFAEKSKQLSAMNVAFLEIQNDLELYLFEVYCAIELHTAEWNSFKTH